MLKNLWKTQSLKCLGIFLPILSIFHQWSLDIMGLDWTKSIQRRNWHRNNDSGQFKFEKRENKLSINHFWQWKTMKIQKFATRLNQTD